ncbi:MAG: hypothetical protein U0522_00985 [Candidatus Paceibacterota bacterium]
MSINYFKKIGCGIFLVAFVFFALFSSFTANAQVAVPVVEVGALLTNTIAINANIAAITENSARLSAKETGLGYRGVGLAPVTGIEIAAQSQISADSIATKVAKIAISSITTSIVKWINSGFKGGPLFVTDPAKFFTGVADRVAGSFIEGSDLEFLCKPFKISLLLALNLNYSYSFKEKIGCTLTDVINNVEGAAVSFQDMGFDGWFKMTQNPQNNIYGANLMAEIELKERIADAVGIQKAELDQGAGFLSSRDCLESNIETQECQKWGPVKTPGKVIETQLNEALGTNLKELQLADEFDEIINALINQAVQKIVTSVGGLSGA